MVPDFVFDDNWAGQSVGPNTQQPVHFYWVHTLSNDEKTNGVQFRITTSTNITPGDGASGTISYTGRQIVFKTAV